MIVNQPRLLGCSPADRTACQVPRVRNTVEIAVTQATAGAFTPFAVVVTLAPPAWRPGRGPRSLAPLEQITNGLVLRCVTVRAPVLPRPWPVEVVVEPAEHHRGVAHRIQVRLLVKPAKEFRRVVKGVDVTDIAHAELGERTLERLGGPHVAGAGGRGEYQDARPTSIAVRAWARTDPIPNHIPGLARA